MKNLTKISLGFLGAFMAFSNLGSANNIAKIPVFSHIICPESVIYDGNKNWNLSGVYARPGEKGKLSCHYSNTELLDSVVVGVIEFDMITEALANNWQKAQKDPAYAYAAGKVHVTLGKTRIPKSSK